MNKDRRKGLILALTGIFLPALAAFGYSPQKQKETFSNSMGTDFVTISTDPVFKVHISAKEIMDLLEGDQKK